MKVGAVWLGTGAWTAGPIAPAAPSLQAKHFICALLEQLFQPSSPEHPDLGTVSQIIQSFTASPAPSSLLPASPSSCLYPISLSFNCLSKLFARAHSD